MGCIMNELSQTIQTVIFVIILALLLTYSLLLFFSKKHKKKIYVVKKRETFYKGLNQTRSKTINCSNYTIDCKYDSSEKIHTLGCSYDIYNQIKEGKNYSVSVKMHHIVSISNSQYK